MKQGNYQPPMGQTACKLQQPVYQPPNTKKDDAAEVRRNHENKITQI